MNLTDKLKDLRKKKNISQEKLAEYLGVSYQAVSKWENGITSPDILLLPDIARYYGITVDELLQVEEINERELYFEYEAKSNELFRNGKTTDCLDVWLEAYKKMPNSIDVKEQLMSHYVWLDSEKYFDKIIELGTEIYNSDAHGYYKGQVISALSSLYKERGELDKSEAWIQKANPIFDSREILFTKISHGQELIDDVGRCIYLFLNELFYMFARLNNENCSENARFTQNFAKDLIKIFELAYPNDEAGFEELRQLCLMHRCVAEDEANLEKNESVIEKHLTRALECAIKSKHVKSRKLNHTLISHDVEGAPENNNQILGVFINELNWECFKPFSEKDWFKKILSTAEKEFNSD